ncbi:hypothetical protein TWF696_000111 [Orbilia brochopaga]|uniref:Uncharacterized protein n=1 Tax=Orbilia brochopaga TaxID=3140254 RepID=A0AAV9VBX2_9PEZI
MEVEFRESELVRSVGPSLRRLAHSPDEKVDINLLAPLSTALPLSIAGQATDHMEGTGGLYLAEGGGSKNVLLLTARHVLFEPSSSDSKVNREFSRPHPSAPRRKVALLGTKAFKELVEEFQAKIKHYNEALRLGKERVERAENYMKSKDQATAESANERLENFQLQLQQIITESETLQGYKEFHRELMTQWSVPRLRTIGHIEYAPPIVFGGVESFTLDYALVTLDIDKFKNSFQGNVLHLGRRPHSYCIGDYLV